MNIRNNRTEARSTSYTDADVFDTSKLPSPFPRYPK